MKVKILNTILLSAIALPTSVVLQIPTTQNVWAQSLWGDSQTPVTRIEKVERDRSREEKTDENERDSRSIPDVVIDDESSEDSTTTTETESDSQTTTTADSKTRFTCQMVDGEYTVMYHPESRPNEAYAWAVPRQMGGGWSPERRCNEISRRLESYRPDGLLEMRTSVENNYNTVCVTTQADSSCRIVFTVPQGQNPELTRDRVFENLTVADSGQQTQGVATLVDDGRFNGGLELGQLGRILNRDLSKLTMRTKSSNAINLRPFLDPADGGTGTRLQGSPFSSNSNSQRLKPENFR